MVAYLLRSCSSAKQHQYILAVFRTAAHPAFQ
eukprot:COSAG06_NODE_34712_length_470_cov_1.549865_1_plen_31_part_01